MADELSRNDPLHCMQRVRSEGLSDRRFIDTKGHTNKGLSSVERGLPHPNTVTIQLSPVFIGLRSTGLPGTVKEFVIYVVSARSAHGAHHVATAEIALAIRQDGGSVSRSGLKLALAELSEGTTRMTPRLLRVSPGRYAMRSDESRTKSVLLRK